MEGMQHFQGGHGAPEADAEEILNRISDDKKRGHLTEQEKETLRKGGYGSYVEDIEQNEKERDQAGEHIPPWLN